MAPANDTTASLQRVRLHSRRSHEAQTSQPACCPGMARTRTSLTPKYSAALTNAACADTPTTISGQRTPRARRAQSRAAFTAVRMDSLPPLVIAPHTPGSPSGPPASAGRSLDPLHLHWHPLSWIPNTSGEFVPLKPVLKQFMTVWRTLAEGNTAPYERKAVSKV